MSATFLATTAKPGFLGTKLAAHKRVANPGKVAMVPMAVLKTKVRSGVGLMRGKVLFEWKTGAPCLARCHVPRVGVATHTMLFALQHHARCHTGWIIEWFQAKGGRPDLQGARANRGERAVVLTV